MARRLVIGTRADGRPPVIQEVRDLAEARGVEVVELPTVQGLGKAKRQVFLAACCLCSARPVNPITILVSDVISTAALSASSSAGRSLPDSRRSENWIT